MDLVSKPVMVAKGGLFVLLAALAGANLVLARPTPGTVALVLIVAWASARFYYFLFYVVNQYLDRDLSYASVTDMVRVALSRRR